MAAAAPELVNPVSVEDVPGGVRTMASSWSRVVTASPERTVCRWQSTRIHPGRPQSAKARRKAARELVRAPAALLTFSRC